MIEKKKTYEFNGKDSNEQEISLSDEFLGSRMKIKKITIQANQSHLYSFACQYDHQGATLQGYVIGSRNPPGNTYQSHLELNTDKEECINLIQVGFNAENQMSYLHIVTSEAQELKWGLQQGEQKHIKRYEWGFFKAKILALPLEND